ncbi:MAG: phosphatase PAP2 family protein [Jatrophihabitantaceae bacterium]
MVDVRTLGWRRLRLGIGAAYVAALLYLLVADGVPTSRGPLALAVVAGLAITCLGRGWRRMLQVGLDWLPFTLVLMLYDKSRSLAATVGMPLHVRDIATAERWLFGGVVPTVWLQQHFYSPTHVHWYDALATVVYTSHFVVTPVLAALLWVRARQIWLAYISRVVLLSCAGLVTYVLFPEAPPWLAARAGVIASVHRLSARGWTWFHVDFANQALSGAQRDGANPVAAMPSLHLALALLAALVLARQLHSRRRYLLLLYPAAMGLTLVYTGEHYVLDLVVGAGYALAADAAMGRFERWRGAREDAPATGDAESEAALAGNSDATTSPEMSVI